MTKNDLMGFFQLFEKFTGYLSSGVPFIFFVAGLGLIFLNRFNSFKLKRRKNISVSAKITKSELFKYISKSGEGSSMMYCPKIEYTYEINDHTYHSDRIAHSSSSFSSDNKYEMESFIEQYPLDKTVSTFVNRENFNDAYLIEKAPGEWILLLIGIAFIIFSFVIYELYR